MMQTWFNTKKDRNKPKILIICEMCKRKVRIDNKNRKYCYKCRPTKIISSDIPIKNKKED
jgi:hypothetical protein